MNQASKPVINAMDRTILPQAFSSSLTSAFPSFSSKIPITPTPLRFPFVHTTLRRHQTKLELKLGSSRNDAVFDEAAFEANRLSLDAKARESMGEEAEREMREADGDIVDPKAWKWRIRKRIWDLMEAQNIAQFPRPVHHRIPNFAGAPLAANKLGELEVFRAASCVKVNPDSPQKQVRFLTLSGGKRLLTPQPRLRTGFFSVLDSQVLTQNTINEACTSVGVAKYGRPIGLDEKIKVDLIVIGSVAVDPRTGARLGKGEGFAELEYGMLRYMGAIDDSTPIVTTVHDEQLVDDIPVDKLLIHDVPVDIICSPTQVIVTNTSIPKPQGIYWDKLSPQKLGQIRILRELKRRIERETGQKLPSGPSEKLPPTAQRHTFACCFPWLDINPSKGQGRGRGCSTSAAPAFGQTMPTVVAMSSNSPHEAGSGSTLPVIPTLSQDQLLRLLQLLEPPPATPEPLSGKMPRATWLLDSGVCNNMTDNHDLFSHLDDIAPSPVDLPNGSQIEALKEGTVVLRHGLVLHNVLYVSQLPVNLISIGQLICCVVTFTHHMCVIQDRITRGLIGLSRLQRGVYLYHPLPPATTAVVCGSTSFKLWHRRMGHPSH